MALPFFLMGYPLNSFPFWLLTFLPAFPSKCRYGSYLLTSTQTLSTKTKATVMSPVLYDGGSSIVFGFGVNSILEENFKRGRLINMEESIFL
jgi:hypothetical protein